MLALGDANKPIVALQQSYRVNKGHGWSLFLNLICKRWVGAESFLYMCLEEMLHFSAAKKFRRIIH